MKSVTFVVDGDRIEIPLTKASDTRYTFELPYYIPSIEALENVREYELVGIRYGIEDQIGERQWWKGEDYTLSYNVLPARSEFIDISTPTQLQNMESGKLYRLVQDIDMTGFEWQPYVYFGCLDGNGYVIKNLTITKPGIGHLHSDISVQSYGLFSTFKGTLYRVVLQNAKIDVNETATVEQVVSFGFLVGVGFNVITDDGYINLDSQICLIDCEVEGDINVRYIAEGSATCAGLIGFGGIVGVRNCEYVGKINITSLMSFDVASLYVACYSATDSCRSYADIVLDGMLIDPQKHAFQGENMKYIDCIFDSYDKRPIE